MMAGLSAAGLAMSSGTAAAAPGFAVGGNGVNVGIGDASVSTSAGNYGMAFGGGVATGFAWRACAATIAWVVVNEHR